MVTNRRKILDVWNNAEIVEDHSTLKLFKDTSWFVKRFSEKNVENMTLANTERLTICLVLTTNTTHPKGEIRRLDHINLKQMENNPSGNCNQSNYVWS